VELDPIFGPELFADRIRSLSCIMQFNAQSVKILRCLHIYCTVLPYGSYLQTIHVKISLPNFHGPIQKLVRDPEPDSE
jgi:hypothetical protein